ncbi:MAG: hypothetical protein H0U24_03695 [Thermoleophilaceae bacterium]|nr:hypothetical protein [Thermoleophilaceae bacterium]
MLHTPAQEYAESGRAEHREEEDEAELEARELKEGQVVPLSLSQHPFSGG